ncbi:BMP family lipoprotein [Phyllobacterium zundukense]|uniref:ABC transporter substrate-binding protein PnrA-like domain-containing protein n=1 Tax=Phyllobacterium zundukense TaxID=1867719 RepID=A0A2N9VYC9_9HYPH|nr:BMP family ABC transporter substrate-binding protein [Phyllobacterium zundukense]ATU95086.1 hypothetical protein BLM14_25355 [Phyllobacterium zundukense]PIO44497.1 hypothetical protein B5P45_11485 [Phyllobacterium zundukense]
MSKGSNIYLKRRWVLGAAVATVLLPGNTGAMAQEASGDNCGYAYVFQEPLASNTAEQTIVKGLERAEAEFGINVDIIDGTGLSGLGDNLRAAASKGCYLAIGTAFFASGEILTQVARDYPEQRFFIEGGVATGPNVTSYAQANEEGTYVAGAMAATMSDGKPIGIITGDDSPPLKAFSAGFIAGAKAVDPDITVLVNSVGSFMDPAKTGAVALSQASKGATLIFPAAGSNLQVYFLGETHGYKTIASDLTDYSNAMPRKPALAFVVASAEDQTNYAIVKQYVEGTQETASKALGLSDGVFSIPFVTDNGSKDFNLPQKVIDAGKKAFDDVVSGRVTVPRS